MSHKDDAIRGRFVLRFSSSFDFSSCSGASVMVYLTSYRQERRNRTVNTVATTLLFHHFMVLLGDAGWPWRGGGGLTNIVNMTAPRTCGQMFAIRIKEQRTPKEGVLHSRTERF
jgi:hypothetical protein